MSHYKRVGIILMTLSVVGIIAPIVLSTGWRAEVDLLPSLLYFLKIELFGEFNNPLIDVHTKYVILFFICTLAVGLLISVGVFTFSSKPMKDEVQSE